MKLKLRSIGKSSGTPAPSSEKTSEKVSHGYLIPFVFFYAICGVLLIWLDTVVLSVASYTLAAALCVLSGWMIFRYVRSSPEERTAGTRLAVGLIMLLTGILIAFNPSYLENTFPVLWALSLIFGAFLKVQYAFDEKSLKITRWWIMLVFAGVSLLIGILAFLRPAFFGDNQNLVIGIMMLIEAVLDITTFILIYRGMKAHKQASFAAAVSAAVHSGNAGGGAAQ